MKMITGVTRLYVCSSICNLILRERDRENERVRQQQSWVGTMGHVVVRAVCVVACVRRHLL